MASTYSDLKIELIGTGEQSGTWGTTTNTNLGTAIEEAITGSADISFTSADVTLTLTDTNTTQSARNLRLNLTGTSGGARVLTVPAIEKQYIINNGLADAVTVTPSGGTGIAVPAGKTMVLFNDGTDMQQVTTHASSLTLGTDLAIADGGTGASDSSTARTNLGLGSMAVQNATAINVSGGTIVGITDLTIADGGTGASTASDARTNLGVAIGTDVQAYNDGLQAISNLAKTDGNFIVANGTTWVVESGATVRTSLGLGDLATLNSVGAAQIDANAVGASELNVSGNGTSGQVLTSDGDGTFSWTTVSNGIGDGQTWQNVAGSRALGTQYTNSTGRSIFVSVCGEGAPYHGKIDMYVNGVFMGRQGVNSVASAGMSATISVVVPNGNTYQANNVLGASLAGWAELR
jgi:hypothetical protein